LVLSLQVILISSGLLFMAFLLIRRVVSHHQGRRIIESLHEQPHLVIGRCVERSSHEGHPPLVNPRLHGREEVRSDPGPPPDYLQSEEA